MTLAAEELERAVAGLEAGRTLPARWYADPAVLELEQEAIFRTAWQYAGRADQLAERGSYLTARCGRVPIVAVRDRDGVRRALVNVCRHRGHEVMSGAGLCATLQCPYHAWTYDLDGRLRGVPRGDAEPGFDPDDLDLHPASLDRFGPFLFVHADPSAPPLAEHLGDLPDVLASTGLDLGRLEFARRTEWVLECNWKVAVENYLECYHCAVAHPDLARMVDVRPSAYGLQERPTFSFQVGPTRDTAGSFAHDGEIGHAQWHWLWPNVALNIEPGPQNLSIDTWTPDGPHRTVGRTDYFFGPGVPAAVREEVMAFSGRLGEEDARLVESVQRGLASGAIDSGRLLPHSERLIAHFQRMVCAALDRSARAA